MTKPLPRFPILCGFALATFAFAAGPVGAQSVATGKWNATGTLLESCTCSVPCSCNFGEGPSPHHYCYSVFAYRLDKAAWDGVDLSGLVIGGSDGPKGTAGFLDARATPAQRPALEKMGAAIFGEGGPARAPKEWTPVAIVHEVKGNDLKLTVGAAGGFTARVIVGRDGVTPVVVENNTVWPIARAIKAKASHISVQDPAAGTFAADGTNANCGTFSFTGSTVVRSTAAVKGRAVKLASAKSVGAPAKSCCAGK